MNLIIRQGSENDFPALLALIKELAEYEKAPEKVTNSVERMKQEQDCFNFFVAELDGEVVGIALYYIVYYTWVGKSLYLDDLYVNQEHRGKNIGTQLLNKVFEIARSEDCQRLRWQVLDWNTPAIQFYEKMGAELDGEWINCDFDVDMIKSFNGNK